MMIFFFFFFPVVASLARHPLAADHYCAVIWISKELWVSVFKLFPNERKDWKTWGSLGKKKKEKEKKEIKESLLLAFI